MQTKLTIDVIELLIPVEQPGPKGPWICCSILEHDYKYYDIILNF